MIIRDIREGIEREIVIRTVILTVNPNHRIRLTPARHVVGKLASYFHRYIRTVTIKRIGDVVSASPIRTPVIQ